VTGTGCREGTTGLAVWQRLPEWKCRCVLNWWLDWHQVSWPEKPEELMPKRHVFFFSCGVRVTGFELSCSPAWAGRVAASPAAGAGKGFPGCGAREPWLSFPARELVGLPWEQLGLAASEAV